MSKPKINPQASLKNTSPAQSSSTQPVPTEAVPEQLLQQELEHAPIEVNGSDKTRVMVVGANRSEHQRIMQSLEATCGEAGLETWPVDTLAQANAVVEQTAIDLTVISDDLPDGAGLALARELARAVHPVETVLIAHEPTADLALEAMRAQVGDVIDPMTDASTLNDRLGQALARQHKRRSPYRRIRRLRELCRQINDARLDVSRQVDSLCDDLVHAYEELAGQMEHAVQSSEYAGQIRDLLDLEDLVRVTLDHLLQKAGPTNAAVFLPMTMDEYSVGGYVNLDMSEDSASLILDHLADVLAPKLTDEDRVIHLTDEDSHCRWLGDDALYLADQQMIAFAANSEEETLAVVMLFRDEAQPFTPAMVEACQAVAPVFGEALCRVVRIHHRHLE